MNLNEEYRPKTFDEVVGQDSIVDALRHDVKDPKPAYLFPHILQVLVFQIELGCLYLQ